VIRDRPGADGPVEGAPTLVLVHGAGDSADVWRGVQDRLATPSCALDVLGRGAHPYDLSLVTPDAAAGQAVRDIEAVSQGPVVLVAHSIGGALSPGIIAGLGSRVRHLVHIAAVAAADGLLPLAVASEVFADGLLSEADSLRAEVRNASYAEDGDVLPGDLRPLTDPTVLARVDALNLGCVATSWSGVDPDLPRTFVQPLRDRLYPPPAQERLAAAMGADEVVAIECGHNVARSAPVQLAAILDAIALRYTAQRPQGS
jgi:pimeloyl-ACP methyl ester carboxylesterase